EVDGGVVAGRLAPAVGVLLRQVLGEHEGVAGPVRAVQRNHRGGRQIHAGIERGDLRVVPGLDGALVHGRQHLAVQLEVLGDAGQVVVDLLGGDRQRDVHQPLVRRDVAAGQVGAGGADVDRPGGGLRDPGAGTGAAGGDRDV